MKNQLIYPKYLVPTVALLAVTSAWPAIAANPMPQDAFTVSPGGVDLRAGRYVVDSSEFTIGDPARGGFDFRRTTKNSGFRASDQTLAQFSHNWMIFRTSTTSPDENGNYTHSITSQGLSATFAGFGTTYYQKSDGAFGTLTRISTSPTSGFIHTSTDGRKITFPGTFATEVRYPNGIIYNLSYNTSNKLKSVVSNAGYALLFEYVVVGTKTFVSKVCGLNLAQQAMPSSGVCPTGVPSVSYGYSGSRMNSITDSDGKVWTIVRSGWQDAFYRPGETQPYLTNHYEQDPSTGMEEEEVVAKQVFVDGREYVYQWTGWSWGDTREKNTLYGLGYIENGSLNTKVSFSVYHDTNHLEDPPIISTGPEQVTDPLGRTTSFYYCVSCANQRLHWKSLPDGRRETYGVDGFRNIIGRSLTPRTGSTESPITTSASFDCTNLTNCNKPTHTIDGRGNRSDFAYDPVHGGVLSETGPADANGVRPVKRYAYTQRSAWIRNSTGGFSQGSSPLWLLSSTRTCKSSATVGSGCAAGASDEVVTTYDYGPNSGPNNLLLRGVVEDAGGLNLRACYAYDATGNKISETKPKAGLTSCT